MKLLWKKTANPEPPPEAVTPPAPQPAAVVAPTGAGINPTTAIAALVTLASVVFTTWSVYDLATPAAPAAVAIAAGAGAELVWLYVLATEWQRAGRTGQLSHGLTATGWGLATLTAVVIAVHGALTFLPLAALAALPLAAKAGWHWQTRLRAEETRTRLEAEAAAARAAAEAQRQAEEEARRREEEDERRQRELSTDLTEEQRAELAALEREAAYVSAKTEKELALEAARAHAEQQRALAEIRRQAEQQMAVDEGAADIEVQRLKLRNKIRLAAPVYTVTELPAGGHHEAASQVPDDLSGLDTPPSTGGVGTPVAGFGFPQKQAPARGAHPADQRVPRVPTPGDTGLSEGERNRRLVLEAYRRLSVGGKAPSISAVAEAAGVSRRTVNRHLPPEMKQTQS
ncbi:MULTISPECIES: hypothetical protein [unclassified Nocardiopsis]|uniref:hypothetical protein n=1 Tax=unclassified Nocardiopsis TaxID=2649073 RepID=UPI0019167F92|nr:MULTISPECIES: hypothetical protein [unclassified Nocardiopsis]